MEQDGTGKILHASLGEVLAGGRLCWMLPSTKNMVILCCLWKAISLLFMPEEFRCRAQGSMEKWEAAQTARNGPSELAVNSARLLL